MTDENSGGNGTAQAARWLVGGVVLVVLIGIGVIAMRDHHASSVEQTKATGDVRDVVISVEGMSCSACASRVKRTLEGLDGVVRADVSLVERNVRVHRTGEERTSQELVEALNKLGYRAHLPTTAESESAERVAHLAANEDLAGQTVTSVTIPTEGMACEFCVKNIEGKLGELDGVKNVRVSLEEKSTRVDFVEGSVTAQRLAEVIEAQGYKAGTPSVKGSP